MTRRLLTFCAISTLVTTTGCDTLFDLGQDPHSLVQVLVTHHATPEDGQFPDKRSPLGNREFDNDEGWTVTLTEAFVVTADVSLQRCDGAEIGVELYWGPLPENLHSDDLDLFTFGGAEVAPGDYCGLSVTYGPYRPSSEGERMHDVPDNETDLNGATFYLAGFAQRGEEIVEFELRNEERLVIDLPIQTDAGGALRVTGDEPFPLELTLSKTYDRLFDGVDFATMPSAELATNALAVLGVETRLSSGTVVAAH